MHFPGHETAWYCSATSSRSLTLYVFPCLFAISISPLIHVLRISFTFFSEHLFLSRWFVSELTFLFRMLGSYRGEFVLKQTNSYREERADPCSSPTSSLTPLTPRLY